MAKYNLLYMSKEEKTNLLENKKLKFSNFMEAVRYARKLKVGDVPGQTLVGSITIETKE